MKSCHKQTTGVIFTEFADDVTNVTCVSVMLVFYVRFRFVSECAVKTVLMLFCVVY